MSQSVTNKSNLANLQTIKFAKLANKEPAELQRLLDACQQQGFFYLDLAESGSSEGLETRQNALSVTKKWFESPMEEKMELFEDSGTRGCVFIPVNQNLNSWKIF